jgi:release factor glutamine methyltransferase
MERRPMRASICFTMTLNWGGLSRCRSVSDAVRGATEVLRAAGVPEAAASAEWLALSVFRRNRGGRAMVRLDNSRPSAAQLSRYADLCRRRERERTPVQYLVGEWDFHRVTLALRPPVLVPRPETEELVELVLKSDLSEGGEDRFSGGTRVLDVGCGSGAILIALLAAQPTWYGVGLDISDEAVALSRENVQAVGVGDRCAVEHAGIAEWPGIEMTYPFADTKDVVMARRRREARRPERGRKEVGGAAAGGQGGDEFGTRLFDVLVSNPPYILPQDMETLPPDVKRHEDVRALAGGGEDGLDVIRQVLRRAPELVRPGGLVWLEVDPSQPAIIAAQGWTGLRYDEMVRDVYGRERFCKFTVL